ncbi:MAG: PmoA family protein, partial [Bryobacterales bacterium]|nr:PmoA family protein [Bryobacterales bacterium]
MLSRRACLSALAAAVHASPVPKMQAVPMPGFQISFERSGREITRYHCNPELRRPFLFPVIGPSGRPVTRMGHPHDPEGH